MDDAESAARLLEEALVFMVEENELSMPAVERLYAALQAAVSVLEAGASAGPPARGTSRAEAAALSENRYG